MNQENPKKLRDDTSFFILVSIISFLLSMLFLYIGNDFFTLFYLLLFVLFLIKSEFSHLKRRINKQHDEVREHLQYLEKKQK